VKFGKAKLYKATPRRSLPFPAPAFAFCKGKVAKVSPRRNHPQRPTIALMIWKGKDPPITTPVIACADPPPDLNMNNQNGNTANKKPTASPRIHPRTMPTILKVKVWKEPPHHAPLKASSIMA